VRPARAAANGAPLDKPAVARGRRRWGLALAWCCALAAGCAGYQVGSDTLYAPDIRTVYVPVFESNSFRRNLGERLTEAVVKEIELKTPFKVVGDPNADSVLTGRIVSDTKRVLVESQTDEPRQIELQFAVEVRWIDRHGGLIRQDAVPLPPEMVTVTQTASLVPEVGQSIATAQQDAIVRLAEQIVGLMEEPWPGAQGTPW
jgi:hypothetical protein